MTGMGMGSSEWFGMSIVKYAFFDRSPVFSREWDSNFEPCHESVLLPAFHFEPRQPPESDQNAREASHEHGQGGTENRMRSLNQERPFDCSLNQQGCCDADRKGTKEVNFTRLHHVWS
jgi:hypothetical protein